MPKRHVRYTPWAAIAPLALGLLGTVAACSEGVGDAPCLPEDVERCTCDDGREGFQVCPLDGGAYSSCDCDLDASPYLPEAGESSGDAQDEEEAAAGLQFMSACSTAAGALQCPAGDTCYDFPAKGQFCSHPCKVATDCTAPSAGCNGMGECKAP
ncbi:MAG: hypothetical protein ACRELB_25060 [Polyangiaceae bacterium]